MGSAALGLFFQLRGASDLGEALRLPDGQAVHWLNNLYPRDYRSGFSHFRLDARVSTAMKEPI